MRINIYNVLLAFLLFLPAACISDQDDSMIRIKKHLTSILFDNNCSKKVKLVVLSENSCSLCYQHVDYEMSQSKYECSFVILSSRKKKINKSDYRELFPSVNPDQLILGDHAALVADLASYTNDVKGPYLVFFNNDEIDVKSVNE